MFIFTGREVNVFVPMDFLHYQPQSELLKQFIDFFYFLETDYEAPVQFYAFPHFNKPLNIHRGFEHEIKAQTISVKGIPEVQPQMLLQGVYTAPILVRFSGSISKLTIIFKDGALNNFMADDFAAIARHHTQVFEAWKSAPGYEAFINAFFRAKKYTEQLVLLETFLLSVLKVREDWPLYQQASKLLKDIDCRLKISDIAKQLFLSERTLYRLVFKYNGISPHNFRKIAQFRHSLETKLVAQNFKNLTDLAYNSNYYDASYFNKIYRSLTLKSPKAFFQNVATYCNKKMILERQ
ncbi:MAG: helix-turn-helix domain-containing protein [Sphingobacteriales bacterium]|nr:MAG: helix-turn-helix domain-containing protein [Sphingobacteriales bacterium]